MKRKTLSREQLIRSVAGIVKVQTGKEYTPDVRILMGPEVYDVTFLGIRTAICKKYKIQVHTKEFKKAETISQLVDCILPKLSQH